MASDVADDSHQEQQKLGIVVGRIAGFKQIVSRVVGQRPVEVLARPIDAGKRLLVQEKLEAVAVRDPLHRLHHQHVVVGRDIRVFECHRQLVLCR